MAKYDVFISYSSQDKITAFYLCDELEKRDIKCWIAPRDEIAGISYAKQILNAISECSVLVVCFSENANKSEHVESEIDNAFSLGKVIIPFRIDNCVMSPEMKYYLNKKHWLIGIPVDEESVDKLAQSIISNIPERAKTREIENSIDNAISMVEDIIKKSDDYAQAMDISLDTSYKNRLNKLQSLSKLVDQMDVSVKVGKWVRQHLLDNKDFLSSTSQEGSCTVITNDENELMIIVPKMDGDVDKPQLIFDGSPNALLRKNKTSSTLLCNLNEDVISRIKENKSILICELDAEYFVSEFRANIKIQYDLDSLPPYHGIDQELLILEPDEEPNKYDLLEEKNGNVILIMSAQIGRPENSAAVLYEDKILLYKNKNSATILENLSEKAVSVLNETIINQITVVEIYQELAVSRYNVRLLKPLTLDLDNFHCTDNFYVPMPLDVSDIKLPEEIVELSDSISKYIHEEEACQYFSLGWKLGERYDENSKITPLLNHYGDLDKEIKQKYRKNVICIFKILRKLGFDIIDNNKS